MFCTPLHSAARRLHHLVACPAPVIDVPVTETDREVIDQLRNLETLELTVPTVPGDRCLVSVQRAARSNLQPAIVRNAPKASSISSGVVNAPGEKRTVPAG
jgi:hypothetical protein